MTMTKCAECGREGSRGFVPARWGWLSQTPKEWQCESRNACLGRQFKLRRTSMWADWSGQ